MPFRLCGPLFGPGKEYFCRVKFKSDVFMGTISHLGLSKEFPRMVNKKGVKSVTEVVFL